MLAADGAANSAVLEKGEERLVAFLLKHYAVELEDIMRRPQERMHYALHISMLALLNDDAQIAVEILNKPEAWLGGPMRRALLRAQARIEATSDAAEGVLRIMSEVHGRFRSLPLHADTFCKRMPTVAEMGRLLSISGTVTRVGAVKVMERSRSFQCVKCQARTVAYPDDAQGGAIPKPAYCVGVVDERRCSNLKFDFIEGSQAEREDYQEIRIQEMTSLLEVGAMPKSLPVILRHDLADACKAGDELLITGWMIARWRPARSGARCEAEFVFVANSVTVNNQRSAPPIDQATIADFSAAFWASHANAPLRGRNILVSSFCPQLFGLHLVKLAVLLTVVGGCSSADDDDDTLGHRGASSTAEAAGAAKKAAATTNNGQGSRKNRAEGHLLLVGDPGTAKSQFLVGAAQISARSVMTTGSGSTNAGLTVAAVREGGDWQLEAGALVLADRGVCCIDEFNALRPHDKTSIHEAMEQQTLSVAKAGLVCKLQTRCSIVAACNAKGKFEENEPISSNVALASPLLSRFDLILVLSDRHSAEWDHFLAASIMEASLRGTTSSINRQRLPIDRGNDGFGVGKESDVVDFETLKRYVGYVKGKRRRSLGMTVAARVILAKYYQLQRRADLRDAARTTIRLLESLIRLGQAHAKLMDHHAVLQSDAIWAIILMETSLAVQSALPLRPDVFEVAPEDPASDYLALEAAILAKLSINPGIFALSQTSVATSPSTLLPSLALCREGLAAFDDGDDSDYYGLDVEASQLLCSWPPTLH